MVADDAAGRCRTAVMVHTLPRVTCTVFKLKLARELLWWQCDIASDGSTAGKQCLMYPGSVTTQKARHLHSSGMTDSADAVADPADGSSTWRKELHARPVSHCPRRFSMYIRKPSLQPTHDRCRTLLILLSLPTRLPRCSEWHRGQPSSRRFTQLLEDTCV